MRIASQLRRLGPALLAALVLCAAVASAGHAHAAASGGAAAFAASAQHAARGTGADLDCALCATASRLVQAAASALASAPDRALHRLQAPDAGEIAPACLPLSRSESRAPPRLG